MAKEVTVLGIEGAYLRGVRLEERNGAFTCVEVESWPLVEEAPETALTAEETAAVAAAVVDALDDGRSSPVDSAEVTVETVSEEDKPLARALRAAVKHFGQSEFSLSLPLSKLLVKCVRMPVEARDDLLGAAALDLDDISPFPDELLAPYLDSEDPEVLRILANRESLSPDTQHALLANPAFPPDARLALAQRTDLADAVGVELCETPTPELLQHLALNLTPELPATRLRLTELGDSYLLKLLLANPFAITPEILS